MNYLAVNAVGPALVAKHFIPLLPATGGCIVAVLSARVGSISDKPSGRMVRLPRVEGGAQHGGEALAIELARSPPRPSAWRCIPAPWRPG
jgi:hypothetical protein